MLGSIPGGFDPYSGANYRVMPERTFKGTSSKKLVIFSVNTEARTPLTVGAQYLVFLDRQRVADEYRRVGDLMIDYCGASRDLKDANSALAILEHSAEYDDVESFLRSYVAHGARPIGGIKYRGTLVDLNRDGKSEAVVRLEDPQWCGSGGCTTLVLSRESDGYTLTSRITITQLPIRVLATSHNGWRDLGVGVAGGGEAAHEVALAFDGRSYPTNPSLAPARRPREPNGRILVGEDDPPRTIPSGR